MPQRLVWDLASVAAGLLIFVAVACVGTMLLQAKQYNDCHRNSWLTRVWHDVQGCSGRQ